MAVTDVALSHIHRHHFPPGAYWYRKQECVPWEVLLFVSKEVQVQSQNCQIHMELLVEGNKAGIKKQTMAG